MCVEDRCQAMHLPNTSLHLRPVRRCRGSTFTPIPADTDSALFSSCENAQVFFLSATLAAHQDFALVLDRGAFCTSLVFFGKAEIERAHFYFYRVFYRFGLHKPSFPAKSPVHLQDYYNISGRSFQKIHICSNSSFKSIWYTEQDFEEWTVT